MDAHMLVSRRVQESGVVLSSGSFRPKPVTGIYVRVAFTLCCCSDSPQLPDGVR